MKDLRKFISTLAKEGELATIDAPVNLDLEMAEIHRRVIAVNGPALLFTRVHNNGKYSPFPLVSNLFGSANRVDFAFGKFPEIFIKDLVATIRNEPSMAALWKNRKTLLGLRHLGLKKIKNGPILEKSGDINLKDLPFTRSWKKDGGFFATLPLVYTEHPENHGHNLGMYRMQRFSESEAGMHWQIHKGGGFHYHLAERENKPLPVTVFFGGPPALILAAISPLPENVPELLLASLLQKGKIPVIKKEGLPHPLIASCEFSLVGEVLPGKRRPEGPFGDHYGYYSLKHPFPYFKVKNIFHRKNAVFPVTVVGKPKQEDFFLGDYLQELLSPIFPMVMPGVNDLWSYGETGYHSLSACVVKERYPREAISSAFSILGQGQLSLTKFLLVTDQKIDLRDFKKVLTTILERTDFRRDLYIFDQLSMDTLDYTGPEINKGSKGIMLGLGKSVRSLPGEVSQIPSWVRSCEVFVPGCLVIDTGKSFKTEKRKPGQMVKGMEFKNWPLIILTDDAKMTVKTVSRFLWTVFTRFEPAGDIYAAKSSTIRNRVIHEAPIMFDCRMKNPYPDELFCDSKTKKLVDKRWKEYFPGSLEMGDSDTGNLDDKT